MNYIKPGETWIERLGGQKHRKDKVRVIKVENQEVTYEYLDNKGVEYRMYTYGFIVDFRKFS